MTVPVPSVQELVERGLATPAQVALGGKIQTTVYRISDEGFAEIREAMRHNAEEAIASGESAWVEPPSRQIGHTDSRDDPGTPKGKA